KKYRVYASAVQAVFTLTERKCINQEPDCHAYVDQCVEYRTGQEGKQRAERSLERLLHIPGTDQLDNQYEDERHEDDTERRVYEHADDDTGDCRVLSAFCAAVALDEVAVFYEITEQYEQRQNEHDDPEHP